MTTFAHDWPNDADGDVFRRLRQHGFNFSREHAIEYNVDFRSWPPSPKAVALLQAEFGPVKLYPPGPELAGYVQFQVHSFLTYENVTSIQRRVSAAMEPYGGACESWGVLQDAAP